MLRCHVMLPLAVLCAVSGGAARATFACGDDPLVAELRAQIEHPERRAQAFEALYILGGAQALEFANDAIDDPDPMVQMWAWRLRLEMDLERRVRWIGEALEHPQWSIRRMAARSAAARTRDDDAIDALLERTLKTEDVGLVLESAADSLARRDPERGARRVHEWLTARGPLWRSCGLFAFASQPAPAYEDVFREAIAGDDSDRRIVAARGLATLGRHAADDPAHGTAEFLTNAEVEDRARKLDAALGPARASSWAELVEAAASASVVVVGEAHASASGSDAQCALLADLVRDWGADATTLLYERPVQSLQAALVAKAAELGIAAESLESDEDARKTAGERDQLARANLLERLKARPEQRWLVVYGDSHRASFVRELETATVPVLGVTTSGTPDVLRAAWACAGTLAIRGKVFRFANGTFFVANERGPGDP